jgi:hypothetical protein
MFGSATIIIVGLMAGILFIGLIDFGKKKCKSDWCVFGVWIALFVLVIFTFLLAFLG